MTVMYTHRSATLDSVNMNITGCCASTLNTGTSSFSYSTAGRGGSRDSIAKRHRLCAGVQDIAPDESGTESISQQPQPTNILCAHGGGSLDLNSHHSAVDRFQDKIDFAG